jgi:hypothetical protein
MKKLVAVLLLAHYKTESKPMPIFNTRGWTILGESGRVLDFQRYILVFRSTLSSGWILSNPTEGTISAHRGGDMMSVARSSLIGNSI